MKKWLLGICVFAACLLAAWVGFSSKLSRPASKPSLEKLRSELKEAGFELWYPAEQGIEPGDIWKVKQQSKSLMQRRPSAIQLSTNAASFLSSSSYLLGAGQFNAHAELASDNRANAFKAALEAASITSLELDFGHTEVVRFPLGELSGIDPQKISDVYRRYYGLASNGSPYKVVVAVVQTTGMRYVGRFKDVARLNERLEIISSQLGGKVDLSKTAQQEVEWKVGGSVPLVMGVAVEDEMPSLPIVQQQGPAPVFLEKVEATFTTLDDDKDYDTIVDVSIQLKEGREIAKLKFAEALPDNSIKGPSGFFVLDHTAKEQLQGSRCSIDIQPNGHDTWRFSLDLRFLFSDATSITQRFERLELNQDRRTWETGIKF